MRKDFKETVGIALVGVSMATIAAGLVGNSAIIADYVNPDLLARVKSINFSDTAELTTKLFSHASLPLGYLGFVKGKNMVEQTKAKDELNICKWSVVCLANGFNPKSFGDEQPDIEPSSVLKNLMR